MGLPLSRPPLATKIWMVSWCLTSLVLRTSDTESAEFPILLIVHHLHKDSPGHVSLGGYLGEEPQPGKQCNTSIGKPEIRGLAAQCMQAELTASKKTVFQFRYLSGQVAMGSNGVLVRAARANSRQRGCNHAGNALGVFKTFNPSLKRRVQAK